MVIKVFKEKGLVDSAFGSVCLLLNGRDCYNYIMALEDSMLVWNLLRQFHIRKLHVSVVLNEYGGTVGEEIQKTTGYIVMRAEGTFDVDVNTSIDKLSEDLSIKMQRRWSSDEGSNNVPQEEVKA
ncbi:hypothetical protein V6N13_084985 [Hibiscus sabdariffa]